MIQEVEDNSYLIKGERYICSLLVGVE